MKEDPFTEPRPDSSDRFIDATLRERGRLNNSEQDEELVAKILTETVNRASTSDSFAAQNQSDRRLWITGAAAVAALVTLLATLLTVLPFRAERNTEEILLVVNYGVAPATEAEPPISLQSPPSIAPLPYEGSIDLVTTPESLPSPLSLSHSDLQLSTLFGQSIEEIVPRSLRQNSFQIVSDETSEKQGIRHYAGNVSLRYEDFLIEADSVDVVVATEETLPSSGMLTARQVKLRQDDPDRFAIASLLEFNPRDGSFILVGVNQFQTSEGDLSTFAPNDRLILTTDSFSVQKAESDPSRVIKYANPLPLLPKR